jgi:hypothetical protein
MSVTLPVQTAAKSRTLRVTWLLTGILAFFPIVSLWVIPWLRSKSIDVPMLTEPGTPEWFIVFVLGSIGCVVLLVGQILAFQNRKVVISARLWAAIAVALTWVLWGYWFYATTTTRTVKAAAPTHSVVLTWKPSTSPVIGYNIYRSTAPGAFPSAPINTGLIPGTTYTDTHVDNGTKYYYTARAVDSRMNQSKPSNVAEAPVP